METILYETRAQHRAFKRGEVLVRAGQIGAAWEVLAGAVVLEGGVGDGYGPVQLALPGDIIGAESLFGDCHSYTSTAIMATQLQRVQIIDGVSAELTLQRAYRQQQRRHVEMMYMRSGAVRPRLSYLLQLLAESNGVSEGLPRKDLPVLRVMAGVIGAALETVCRELNVLMPPAPEPASAQVLPIRPSLTFPSLRAAA